MSLAELFFNIVMYRVSPLGLLMCGFAILVLFLFVCMFIEEWHSKSNDIIKLLAEIKDLLKNTKRE